jgi:hypothetical protein
MSIHSVYCPVSHERVPCDRDFDGQTLRVFCGELTATGECRRQERAHGSGWLGEFLQRAEDHTLDTRGRRCRLLDATSSGTDDQ